MERVKVAEWASNQLTNVEKRMAANREELESLDMAAEVLRFVLAAAMESPPERFQWANVYVNPNDGMSK